MTLRDSMAVPVHYDRRTARLRQEDSSQPANNVLAPLFGDQTQGTHSSRPLHLFVPNGILQSTKPMEITSSCGNKYAHGLRGRVVRQRPFWNPLRKQSSPTLPQKVLLETVDNREPLMLCFTSDSRTYHLYSFVATYEGQNPSSFQFRHRQLFPYAKIHAKKAAMTNMNSDAILVSVTLTSHPTEPFLLQRVSPAVAPCDLMALERHGVPVALFFHQPTGIRLQISPGMDHLCVVLFSAMIICDGVKQDDRSPCRERKPLGEVARAA